VKHFRHMLEERHITFFTDHKRIIYAFQQRRDKCSPRQFNHLDYIAQFTTDIRHVSGQNNIVADAVSRVESVTVPPSYEALTAAQNSEEELRTLPAANNALRLENQHIPGTTVSIYCDTVHSRATTTACVPVRPQCLTRGLRQRPGWLLNVSCSQAYKRTAELGHGLVKPANTPKSTATQLPHCEISRRRQPVFVIITST
jgi:hypothetical protein